MRFGVKKYETLKDQHNLGKYHSKHMMDLITRPALIIDIPNGRKGNLFLGPLLLKGDHKGPLLFKPSTCIYAKWSKRQSIFRAVQNPNLILRPLVLKPSIIKTERVHSSEESRVERAGCPIARFEQLSEKAKKIIKVN